jgi:hypothetical protein
VTDVRRASWAGAAEANKTITLVEMKMLQPFQAVLVDAQEEKRRRGCSKLRC